MLGASQLGGACGRRRLVAQRTTGRHDVGHVEHDVVTAFVRTHVHIVIPGMLDEGLSAWFWVL